MQAIASARLKANRINNKESTIEDELIKLSDLENKVFMAYFLYYLNDVNQSKLLLLLERQHMDNI